MSKLVLDASSAAASPAWRTVSPPLAFASSRIPAAMASKAVTDDAWSGYVAIPTLTVIGSRSVSAKRRLRSTSPVRSRSTTGSRCVDRGRRRDQQELVGAVAAQLHPRLDVLAQRRCDGEQRLVAGLMPVVVVEQPEVVDVDEGDPDRPDVVTRRARSPGRGSPTSAPWLSVSVSGSRRVDSSRAVGLAREPSPAPSGRRGTAGRRRRAPPSA